MRRSVFDSESNRQLVEWCSKNSLSSKKSRLQKLKVKTVLISFFDKDTIIHHEFVLECQSANMASYNEVLNLTRTHWCVHPELYRIGEWELLNNIAPTRCTMQICQFFAQRGLTVLEDPPYSSNLTPANTLHFPASKRS
ncbi:hypothetical protein Trydic_g5345 [Trypoxylus dichotomus]